MSYSADEASGIVRTASGRMTYAPDGHTSNLTGPKFEAIRGPMEQSRTPSEKAESDDITVHGSRRQSFASADADFKDELTRLATKDQEIARADTLALKDDDPSLDPSSKEFDLYKWMRKFMQGFDEEGVRSLRAGVVYKDLSVSGSGSALQLQQTVSSILLEPFRNLTTVLGHTKHKQILNSFDGVLKSGEMLIVLGRPGSGCSTLLKTICGELSGLTMSKESEIHYNGRYMTSVLSLATANVFRHSSKADDEGIQGRGRLQSRGEINFSLPSFFLLLHHHIDLSLPG